MVIGWGDMAKPTHRFLAFDKKEGKVSFEFQPRAAKAPAAAKKAPAAKKAAAKKAA